MRRIIPLNFDWYFAKKRDGLTLDEMTIINIPHNNVDLPLNHINELDYQFESIYKKKIYIDKQLDKRYMITFDGVLHQAMVSVNDIVVGKHSGGYTAFKFDITQQLKNGENWITVDVDSRETLDIPPFGHVIDYLTYGGIYREVYLTETDIDYIEDVRIKTKNLLTHPEIMLDVYTTGGKAVEVSLIDQDMILHTQTFQLGHPISFHYPVELWTLESPKLYTLRLTLDHKDTFTLQTGFREAYFQKDGFYLNGKKIKISGLNRHQIYPHVGYAMPKSGQVMDAKILKQTVNAVRTSHYPQSQHFIDACDELGVLVFIEAPGWQYVGGHAWQENYKEVVKDMIRQYRHHPSIILYGVRVNESGDYHDLYEVTNQLARTLDDKPTGGVRCFAHSEELEDVYTYNDFIHNGTNTYLKPIDQIFSQEKPYLITEFNGHMFPTKTFDSSEKRLEHALRYANIMNAYMGDPNITGAFGWQFIDYNTHKELGSSDQVCYHGVYDIFRIPKEAAKVYQSQIATKPYLEVLHGMDIGDYNQSFIDHMVIASNCETIDLYQNERFVGTFTPNKDEFPHLDHPLYIIKDFYGDAYQKDLGISKEASQTYIELAHGVAKRGGLDKVLDDESLDREKLNVGWQMYGKYIANWGSGVFTYTLIGHYQDQTIERKMGPYTSIDYIIKADSDELIISNTYDVTRVTLEAVDQYGQHKPYCFDAFQLETNDCIEIIGPKQIGLIGGQYAFWIKSVKPGKGKLSIRNHKVDQMIHISVVHEVKQPA